MVRLMVLGFLALGFCMAEAPEAEAARARGRGRAVQRQRGGRLVQRQRVRVIRPRAVIRIGGLGLGQQQFYGQQQLLQQVYSAPLQQLAFDGCAGVQQQQFVPQMQYAPQFDTGGCAGLSQQFSTGVCQQALAAPVYQQFAPGIGYGGFGLSRGFGLHIGGGRGIGLRIR